MGFASTFLIFFTPFFGDNGSGLGVPPSARLAAASAASCLRRCATTAAAVAAMVVCDRLQPPRRAQNNTQFSRCPGEESRGHPEHPWIRVILTWMGGSTGHYKLLGWVLLGTCMYLRVTNILPLCVWSMPLCRVLWFFSINYLRKYTIGAGPPRVLPRARCPVAVSEPSAY